MKKTAIAAAVLAATISAGVSTGAQAAKWSFQYFGVDVTYDPAQDYDALGVGQNIDDNIPTLRDSAVNGDQSFGVWGEGTESGFGPANFISIFRNNVFYDFLSDVRVDFRLVLRDEAGGINHPFDFGAPGQQIYQLANGLSFFDLLTDQDPSNCTGGDLTCTEGAWGIGLDTADTVTTQYIGHNADLGGTTSLEGQLFNSSPGTFELPAVTDNGRPLGSIISAPTDALSFNISYTGISFDDPTCGAVDLSNCNDNGFTAIGSGEVSFEVPAPATVALLGLGLLGLGGLRRRKQG